MFSHSMHFNIWSWLNWFQVNVVKMGWGVTLAASLWSLWLNRNRALFENKLYSIEDILLLIKVRSSYWCQATNLIS